MRGRKTPLVVASKSHSPSGDITPNTTSLLMVAADTAEPGTAWTQTQTQRHTHTHTQYRHTSAADRDKWEG